MNYKALALGMALTGCGTEAANTGVPVAKSANEAPPSSVAYGAPVTKPDDVTVEYRKSGGVYALAVNDTKDMPVCARENNQQLVYVKNQDKFFSCEDNWVEIDIRGKDGASGSNGADGQTVIGAAGPAGVAGADGAKGDKGDKGDPGTPVSPNQWFDPITGRTWLIGSTLALGLLPAQPPCQNEWGLASLTDLREAIHHGLALASSHLNGPATFWSTTFNPDPNLADIRAYLDATGLEHYNSSASFSAGVACLKAVQ